MKNLVLLFTVFLIKRTVEQEDIKTEDEYIEELFFSQSSNGETPSVNCVCVPQTKCITKNNVITLRSELKFECPNMEICCDPLNINEMNTTETNHFKQNTGEFQECGIRNPEGIGFRIVGGETEAQFGEYPWMITIMQDAPRIDSSRSRDFICGGSLIHEQVILTAAHCINQKNKSDLMARAGEWDSQTITEKTPHQDRNISSIIIHKGFINGGHYDNNIALLVLDKPFILAENVQIVCLPKQGDTIVNNACIATGWGKDNFGNDGIYQTILRSVVLPIVPRDRCIQELRKTDLGQNFNLHVSYICAGGIPGKDTCKGDGGSPLVCPIPGQIKKYQQVGIVAWGIKCGTNVPGAYVNVAYFRNWIDQEMSKLNLKDVKYGY